MNTVTTFMTAMTTINHALAVTKTLRDVDLKLNEAENKNKISELYLSLSDIKIEIANLKTALIEKDEEIKRLNEQVKIAGEMKFNGVLYFRQQGNSQEGPFCPQCYDNEKKTIRLHNYQEGWWECKTCESRYDEDYRKSDRNARKMIYDYDPFER